MVGEGVTVDGEAVGSTRLVHAGVSLADRLLDVHVDRVLPADFLVELFRDFGHAVLRDQREDRGLDRRHPRVELHVHLRRSAFVGRVGLAQEGERAAIGARGRFDHVGEIPLILLLVEIPHLVALAAVFGMLAQVII